MGNRQAEILPGVIISMGQRGPSKCVQRLCLCLAPQCPSGAQRSLKPEGLLHMASLNSQPSLSSMKLSFFLLWKDWYSGMSMIRPIIYKNIRELFVF